MEGYKEFQGKDLDNAIREACVYFDTTRERLEIDIVQDSKSGIFGLVGARKAKVRARRVHLRPAVDDVLERLRETAPPEAPAPKHTKKPPRAKAPPVLLKPEDSEPQSTDSVAPASVRPAQKREKPAPAPTPLPPPLLDDMQADEDSEGMRTVPLESLDRDRLFALSTEVVLRLVQPIVGATNVRVEIAEGRVCAHVDSGESSGLLIGREGQTLASLQYLASRMVSRGMNAVVRVQLDAGEYRLRQDEKLRDIAHTLAERVRATGRPQSTRPLSSYHRRIIHVLFQDDPQIQTRSSGEGPLKRVVVQRRRV